MHRAFERGQTVGCETIQVFTRSPSRWAAPRLTKETIRRYKEKEAESGISPVIAHDSYLPNLGSPDDDLWRRSLEAFLAEMIRCEQLSIPYLVMHPGAHMGSGGDNGLGRIATAFREIYTRLGESGVIVLLETTAGAGSILGDTFEQLACILGQVDESGWLGICLDICHVFAAGYDLRTSEGYEATFKAFDRVIGLDRLKVFHLNDSQNDLGSHIDRHEHIGKGFLGIEPFRMLLNDPRFRGHPMLLETPKSKDMHEDLENLSVLRELIE